MIDSWGQSKIITIVVDDKDRGNFTLTPDIMDTGEYFWTFPELFEINSFSIPRFKYNMGF